MAEIVTKEKFKELLTQLFPTEILGFKRPEEPIPTNIEFDTEMPQWIRKDPAFFATLNAFFCRCLSNDERCREWINECMAALEKQDFNIATQKIKGLMSAADKKKLDGVSTGAEVNQNAFSNVKAGAQTVAATTKTDTVELAAGGNIAFTVKDKVITINTKNIADGAEVNQNAFSVVQVGTEKINAADKTDTLQLAAGKNITIKTDSKTKKITLAVEGDLGINLLKRDQEYEVGDIAYSKNLPSWARLECVHAGTTSAVEPDFSQVSAGGALIDDGSVCFIIEDMRDGTPVGWITGRLYLPAGYVKANGATVQRADYPRLVALADKYSLWTEDSATYAGLFGIGDDSTTMVLPDWRGVVKRYLDDGKGYDTNRVLGTYQDDMFKSHVHNVTHSQRSMGYGYGSATTGQNQTPSTIQTEATGGSETRMKNISEMAVIRY